MNRDEDFNALQKDIQDFYLLICDKEEGIINVVDSKAKNKITFLSTLNDDDDDVTKKDGKKENFILQQPTADEDSLTGDGTTIAIVGKNIFPLTTTTSFIFENHLKENAQISKTFVKLIKAYWKKEDFALKARVVGTGGGATFSSLSSAVFSKTSIKQQQQQEQENNLPKIEDYFKVEKKKTNRATIDTKNLTLEFIIQKIFLIQKEVDEDKDEDEEKEKVRVRLLKSFSSELYESLSLSNSFSKEGVGGERKKDKSEREGDKGKNNGEEYFPNSGIDFVSIYSIVWLICVWINIEMKSKIINVFQCAAPSILKRYFSFKNLDLSIANLKENVESEAANVFLSLSPNRIWKSVEFSNNKNKIEAILLYNDESDFFSENFFKKMSALLEFSDENTFFQKYVKTGRLIAFNTHFCRMLKIFSFAVESILFDITEQREEVSEVTTTTTTTTTTSSLAMIDESEQWGQREREHEKEKEDGLQQQQQQHVEQFRRHILIFGTESKLFFHSLPKSLQQKYKESNITNNLDKKGASKQIINIFQKINLL
uniref:Uncharacterized protein n=1 Tax=Armadillidium vulgare clopovirus TaxID=2984284 RepID=A0A9C7BX95_9VIRU|nr:MAG: hypothetical protein [Armadillidium vulgare clopovirus]